MNEEIKMKITSFEEDLASIREKNRNDPIYLLTKASRNGLLVGVGCVVFLYIILAIRSFVLWEIQVIEDDYNVACRAMFILGFIVAFLFSTMYLYLQGDCKPKK